MFCRAVVTDSFVMSDNVSSLQQDNKKLFRGKQKKLFRQEGVSFSVGMVPSFLVFMILFTQTIHLLFVLAKGHTKHFSDPSITTTKDLGEFLFFSKSRNSNVSVKLGATNSHCGLLQKNGHITHRFIVNREILKLD